jgi:hypothetical protein
MADNTFTTENPAYENYSQLQLAAAAAFHAAKTFHEKMVEIYGAQNSMTKAAETALDTLTHLYEDVD